MRPWLALTHAGATFKTRTVELPDLRIQGNSSDAVLESSAEDTLTERRTLGSVRGLFPVLQCDGIPIHESLAICEFAADTYPNVGLWPQNHIDRGLARAISCEMLSGFHALRNEMSCHLFGRVADFKPSEAARSEITRVFELWDECLERSGGPFLFGDFGIADAMYFPVLTRFRTYRVSLPGSLSGYAKELENQPAVKSLVAAAATAPRIAAYDDYLHELGGDPDATLPVSGTKP